MPFLPFLSIVFVSSLFHLFISIETLCMSELNDWMSSNRKAIIDVAYSFLSFELIYRMVYAKISANILGFLFCFFPIFFFLLLSTTQPHSPIWVCDWRHGYMHDCSFFLLLSLCFRLSLCFIFFQTLWLLTFKKRCSIHVYAEKFEFDQKNECVWLHCIINFILQHFEMTMISTFIIKS